MKKAAKRTKTRTQYYLLQMVDGIDPRLYGPYINSVRRDSAAKCLHTKSDAEGSDEDVFVALDSASPICVQAYAGAFFTDNGRPDGE